MAKNIKTNKIYTKEEHKLENYEKSIFDTIEVKITKKNGLIHRIVTVSENEKIIESLAFYYKNESLIICFYMVQTKKDNKRIFNTRYYSEDGKCVTSVLQDAVNENGEVDEVLGESDVSEKRYKESQKYLKLAKSEKWDNFCNEKVESLYNFTEK